MKAPSPAFSFYPKDFLADPRVMSMTNAAVGIYSKLLCACWLDESIPNDSEKLRRIVGADAAEWADCWPQVADCFTVSEDGSALRHLRLDEEREKQRARSRAQSEKARKRWADA